MVRLVPLLAVASTASAYSRGSVNSDARLSLFEAALTSEAPSANLTDLECGSSKKSSTISLSVDHCLWGEYFLVNNLKITDYPTCANDAEAVVSFYSTTSCSGAPTFQSNGKDIDITDRCLFGSSPQQWSMIFRCENFDSQFVARNNFKEAKPPGSRKHIAPLERVATDGVLTPYATYACNVWKPIEPTFLAVDTCLKVDSHSIFVSQPAICANGKAAELLRFKDSDCLERGRGLGMGITFPDRYFKSLDKQCHRSEAPSVAFVCNDSKMKKFEDVSEHNFPEVKPLRLLDAPAKPIVEEGLKEPENFVPATSRTKYQQRPRPRPGTSKTYKENGHSAIYEENGNRFSLEFSSGSNLAEDKDGDEKDGNEDEEPKKPSKAKAAKIRPFHDKECESDRPVRTQLESTDKCIWTFMYSSMQVVSPAICANGTQALFATYSRPGCHLEDRQSFGDIPESYAEGCADTEEIKSMSFICNGLPESEIGNKGSVGGFFKFIGIVILVLFLMIGLTVLSCCLRGAAMMRQASEVWARIMALINKRDGAIQL